MFPCSGMVMVIQLLNGPPISWYIHLIECYSCSYIEAGKDLAGKGFDPRKLLSEGTEEAKKVVQRQN